MSPITRLDTWIIERVVEPLLWRIEAHTGINSFATTRLILIAYPICNATYFLKYAPPNVPKNTIGVGLTILTSIVAYFLTIYYERQIQRDGKNFLKRDTVAQVMRIQMLCFTGIAWLILVPGYMTVGLTVMLVVVYALCCHGKPPDYAPKTSKELVPTP